MHLLRKGGHCAARRDTTAANRPATKGEKKGCLSCGNRRIGSNEVLRVLKPLGKERAKRALITSSSRHEGEVREKRKSPRHRNYFVDPATSGRKKRGKRRQCGASPIFNYISPPRGGKKKRTHSNWWLCGGSLSLLGASPRREGERNSLISSFRMDDEEEMRKKRNCIQTS